MKKGFAKMLVCLVFLAPKLATEAQTPQKQDHVEQVTQSVNLRASKLFSSLAETSAKPYQIKPKTGLLGDKVEKKISGERKKERKFAELLWEFDNVANFSEAVKTEGDFLKSPVFIRAEDTIVEYASVLIMKMPESGEKAALKKWADKLRSEDGRKLLHLDLETKIGGFSDPEERVAELLKQMREKLTEKNTKATLPWPLCLIPSNCDVRPPQ